MVTKGRAKIDPDEDEEVSVEPVSVSSVRPTSESDSATGSRMDVDPAGVTSSSRKRPLQVDGDRVQLKCVHVMTQRIVDFLTKWRRWWGTLLQGQKFTSDTEISFIYRHETTGDLAFIEGYLQRCVVSERSSELMLEEEVLTLSYIRRRVDADLYNYTVALPRRHCWSVIQAIVAILRTAIDDYSAIPFVVKVANVVIAVFVVSVVMRSRAKKLDKCVSLLDAVLRMLKENGPFRDACEKWTLQVIRDWYEDGECVFLVPCTRRTIRDGYRYLPIVRHYCVRSVMCEPQVRYSVATMTPMWRPVVTATKVFNLLADDRMDRPEIVVVCDDSRVSTRLMEWQTSGVRRCVTLNAARLEDQELRRLLLAEVLKDAESFRVDLCGTTCSATFLSSSDVVKGFLDADALGDSILLDADDVIDVLVRPRTLMEYELVRGVSERAVAAGILFEGKALEDLLKE